MLEVRRGRELGGVFEKRWPLFTWGRAGEKKPEWLILCDEHGQMADFVQEDKHDRCIVE